jgi:hypothetical protein
MRKYIKGAAIALLLSGTALATTGAARADDGYGNNYRNDRPNGVVTVQFGDVAMGYRDGYRDNEQRWHRWNNDGDYQAYRNEHRDTYRDYNHDRDASNVTIGFGNVAFGYRDGYWDNGHRWHHWRHRNDYRGYRDENGSNFHDMNHDRENNDGWQGR